jgi:hypothetical protein
MITSSTGLGQTDLAGTIELYKDRTRCMGGECCVNPSD